MPGDEKLVVSIFSDKTFNFITRKLKMAGFNSIEEFYNEKLLNQIPELKHGSTVHGCIDGQEFTGRFN